MLGTPGDASAFAGMNIASRRSAHRSWPQPCIALWTSWSRSFAAPSVSTRVVTSTSTSLSRGLKAPVDERSMDVDPRKVPPECTSPR